MDTEDRSQAPGLAPAADAQLIRQLRQGDAEAGHQLVREYYPGVYRYLLYLTGRPELAEDLTQETFLQAWRRLDTFEGRAPLRLWLHRIAHREFLQALRSQRSLTSLEEVAEPPAPRAADWTEAMELRDAIRKLPVEEREVVALHYLQGYRCEEIAQIVRTHVSTVKYRLTLARTHLQRELGEGDLAYLNEPGMTMRRWAWLPLEALTALEARLSMVEGRELRVESSGIGGSAADLSTLNPQLSTHKKGEQTMSDPIPTGMSRRKLLESAGTAAAAAAAAGLAGAAAAAAPQNEADVVDSRLTRKVSCAFKATALADLCEQIHAETGIQLSAGPSVADEKVTVFCEKLPLREVMRQLSRPFGYTWLRSKEASGVGRQALGESPVDPNAQRLTPNAQYRYELVQDLRSQLLEEELRNRDRNTAFLALEREIQRYRPYLDLSPDEALARAKTAPPEEKPLLETIGRSGWGAIQLYFRLTPPQLAALRAGEDLHFSQVPKAGELPLPADMAKGVLQSARDVFFRRYPDGFGIGSGVTQPAADDLPPIAVPEARASVHLSIHQTELGQFALKYDVGIFSHSDLPRNSGVGIWEGDGALATGTSPMVVQPDNRGANARLVSEPDMRGQISIVPAGACGADIPTDKNAPRQPGAPPPGTEKRVTTADVLEALHRAAGMPIVADFYTRLYAPAAVSVPDQPLFDALNHLAETMRLRWHKEENWLQLRSASYYDDRLKEVPNRLLSRWGASRRQHGFLTLDDLVEIAGLSDAQLDAEGMAEGVRACWGLAEWHLARAPFLRPHLRFLATLTPAQRQEAMSDAGLPFPKMSLAQQQQYIGFALVSDEEPLQSLEELAGAVLRVDYTQPGGFEWRVPGENWFQWVLPVESGRQGRRTLMPPVRGRSREAALEAARRLAPQVREAMRKEAQRNGQFDPAQPVPQESQILPTELNLKVIYIPGLSNQRDIRVAQADTAFHLGTW